MPPVHTLELSSQVRRPQPPWPRRGRGAVGGERPRSWLSMASTSPHGAGPASQAPPRCSIGSRRVLWWALPRGLSPVKQAGGIRARWAGPTPRASTGRGEEGLPAGLAGLTAHPGPGQPQSIAVVKVLEDFPLAELESAPWAYGWASTSTGPGAHGDMPALHRARQGASEGSAPLYCWSQRSCTSQTPPTELEPWWDCRRGHWSGVPSEVGRPRGPEQALRVGLLGQGDLP